MITLIKEIEIEVDLGEVVSNTSSANEVLDEVRDFHGLDSIAAWIHDNLNATDIYSMNNMREIVLDDMTARDVILHFGIQTILGAIAGILCSHGID
jgi:hypothetical protein